MPRRKILALSFFPAFVPPQNGGVERLVRIYSLLAEQFDVTLISSTYVRGDQETIRHAPGFTEVRVPKDGYFEECYQQLLKHSGKGDLSGPALGICNRRFGALHDAYLEHYATADFIIHDSPFLIECDLFRGFDNKIRVYNSYNFETGLYRSFHSNENDDIYIENLVEELERDLCRHADLITVCAENDRKAFTENFAPKAPIELVPNGFMPTWFDARTERTSNRILFLGSNHKPNADAAKRIVNELAPAFPNYEFHIVGSCYPRKRTRNIVAHGLVDRLEKEALLLKAAVAINPMESGSGSSLKIADIARSGLPLLSSELGARGFNLEPGVHYLPLDPSNLVDSLRSALADRERLSAVAERARDHINAFYSWPKIVEQFASRLNDFAPRDPTTTLVVNDYDSLTATGGGGIRTSGLCRGLAERSPVIFIAFSSEPGSGARRLSDDGKILSILVDKSRDHLAEHESDNRLYWISTADIVNGLHAPLNERMRNLFRCAAAVSNNVVCEHAYMIGLPTMFGIDFVYSSHNFEYGLKKEALKHHPRAAERIETVRQMEMTACAMASLIVAVSEDDARALSGTYRYTAPIMVVPNGAAGPVDGKLRPRNRKATTRPIAIFMGSAHGPNIQAAQWIIDELAPSMPGVDFALIGSVAESVEGKPPSNVQLLGRVSEAEKTKRLYSASVALNPITTGSGSNVKLADYLQHGLHVVSTAFGSRGYAAVPADDLTIVDLDGFAASIESLLAASTIKAKACADRQLRYLEAFSMDEGGRRLRRLIEENKGNGRRALYVTYRYNDPPQGGGEDYVVRLVHALAADGWSVDVASPEAERIDIVGRFGAHYAGGEQQPVPIEKARIRSAKFEIDDHPSPKDLHRIWQVEPKFEAHLFRGLPNKPPQSALAWGWGDSERRGRWCMTNAGIYMHKASKVTLAGDPQRPIWLQIFSETGELIYDLETNDVFQIECDLPSGFVEFRTTLKGELPPNEPRPLAIYVWRLDTKEFDFLSDRPIETWARENEPAQFIEALTDARRAVRDANGVALTKVRNGSKRLLEFVNENMSKYDLLITHNAVFGGPVAALRIASEAGVPSIFIPHLHYDDDFYHFQDVIEACATASRTLVCPRIAMEALAAEGLTNLEYHTPGIEAGTQFNPEDAAAFRQVLGSDEDFFLVLGRKSAAKGYEDVIRAAEQLDLPSKPRIVLIGPDDDRLPVKSQQAIYLGRQPAPVVRGALMECIALINMSRSESFGIVLLEAGLAEKPVLANRNCAAFADLVEDDVNGFLTAPAELGGYMAKLIEDPQRRIRLGTAGRKRAISYDWKLIERDFVALCDELAGNSK